MSTANISRSDLDAKHYVQHSSLQNTLATKILSTYPISHAARILDIGCGDGRITASLAQHSSQGRVLGIDASANMIETASKIYSKELYPNLDFKHSMAEDLGITELYDNIVSFSCFHWLKDPSVVFGTLRSILKPGGELLILTYPKESPYYNYMENALESYPDYAALSANRNMLSVDEYRQILQDNNFEILSFEEQKLYASYNNADEIKQFIKGWLNCYVQLPENETEQYLEDVSQLMISDPSTHREGKIEVPYIALIIKAQKL